MDSRPTSVGPLSMTRSIRPSRSARTCSARVGDSRFDRFALGPRSVAGPLDQAASHVRRGHPQADGRLAGGDDVRDSLVAIQDEVSGPGQNRAARISAASGHSVDAAPGLLDIGHVDDQRIDGGSSLGREDPRDGFASVATAPSP